MLTVAALMDVVQSQLCVHGNHKLFVKPSSTRDFFLFVNDSASGQVLNCQDFNDSCIQESSLTLLAKRLEAFDDSDAVSVSTMDAFSREFQIGFKSDEGFIETIHSSELTQDVLMEDE